MATQVDILQLDEWASDPASPVEGQVWYNTTEKVLKSYQGGAIQVASAKNKFDATIAPTTSDDSSAGYSVGSRWINVTADKEYVCLDATASAAVWKETSAKGWPWTTGKVLTVGPDADYTTIGAAISAASAGDIILIQPGAYPEQITVDKTLALIGLAPTNYSWDAATVVLNPTITTGAAAVTLTADAGLSVFQNLRVASQHQTGVLDSYGVLIQSMAGGTTYWDNCVIGPEIVSGASPTTRVRSVWVQTNAIVDFRDCQLAVDDPSNIATEVPPVVAVGTSTVRLLNSRVKNGVNYPGDVSIQDTAKLELVASIIEGTLDEGGTNNTTTYIDAASRINAVSADYTDDDTQAKIVHREYGLVDTGGQKDLYKLNLRSLTSAPGSVGNGNVWYDSSLNRFRVRENGVTKYLRSLWDGGQFVTVDAGGGADYTTIQAAIDAVAADSNVTILVAPGTYTELLTLKSGITIRGVGTRPASLLTPTSTVIVTNPTPSSPSTLLTYSSATGTTVCLENMEFLVTGGSLTGAYYLLNVTGSGGSARVVRFNNCRLGLTYGDSTGGATCQLVLQPSGTATVVFDGCGIAASDIYSTGVWANNAAFNVNANATCINSIYNSSAALRSFYVPTGGILDLYDNPKVTRIERAGTGTVNQYGSLGNIAVIGDADDGSGTGEINKYDYGHYLTNGTKAMQKLNLRSIAGDIPTPADGNVWYNSSLSKLRARVGGATVNVRTSTTRFEIGVSSTTIITTGAKGRKTLSFAGTIVGWRVVSDQNTNATLDVWKANGSIPTNANSITGTGKPSLTAAQLNSGNVSLWTTTTVAAGDVIILEVEANSAATYIALELEVLLDG